MEIAKMGNWSGYFGYAEKDITPPLGIYARNWGAAKFDNATGIHRPLLLQCVIFDSQENPKILVTADLGWWKNNEDEFKLRQALLAHFDLSVDQLLFCLSHTHAGPSICSSDVHLPGGEFIAPYLDFIRHSAILCVQEALAQRTGGTLIWSTGSCALAINRDLEIDGKFFIGYNPLKEADHTLLVGQLRDSQGDLKVVLSNYACHPTSFAYENTLISPDFVGAARQTVWDLKSVPCVFLQGASGELAPKKQYVADPDIVDANGRILGYAILSTLETADKPNTTWEFKEVLVSGAPLALWKEKNCVPSTVLKSKRHIVRVPYKTLSTVEEIEREWEACDDRVLKDRLWRKLNTRKSIGNKTLADIPVWVWQIGNSFVVAQPNEAYSAYQRVVREAFPGMNIIFINIANGYVGYLPPSCLYENDMYAVWQTPYARGSLEMLIKETIKEIQTYLDA